MKFNPIDAISASFMSLGLADSEYFIDHDTVDGNDPTGKGWYVASMDQTWEMHLDDNYLITSVTLFPRMFYSIGLPLNALKTTIRYKFGEPLRHGNEPCLANIKEGAWDEYENNSIYYHFEYESPLMTLVLVEIRLAH